MRERAGGVASSDATPPAPGTILDASGRLLTATDDNPLEILELQPAGKRSMSAPEFLRGHRLGIGDSFSPA